jgi:hypothetical protein
MKRLGVLVLVACALGVACDDDNPAAPSGQPVVFSALLSPASEVPPVANSENSGRGAMQLTLNTTRAASGAITAATANIHFQLYDFPDTTRVQGAHVHTGFAGVNGGVRVDTGLTPATALTMAGGGVTFNVIGVTVDPVVAQGIIDNPQAWYFNVHSPVNPGGFARGQLSSVQ